MSEHAAVDIAVVGGGIAGLSAALVGVRDAWTVRVIDASGGGGRLLSIEEVHDYPNVGDVRSGPDVAAQSLEAAMDRGVEFVFDEAARLRCGGLWTIECADAVVVARTVVLACGQTDGSLGFAGEAQLRGHGLSYCASCDAPLFAARRVVVVGTGDWAVDEAIYLARYAASTVMVCPLPELQCTPTRHRLLETSGVTCHLGVTPLELLSANGSVAGLALQTDTGRVEVPADGVFPFVGHRPALPELPEDMPEARSGILQVDADRCADARGLFAAGDVTKQAEGLVIEAAAEGQRAGRSASAFLAASKPRSNSDSLVD